VLHRLEVKDIGLTKIDLPQDWRKILPPAVLKIIDSAKLLAPPQQFECQRRSDKAANARDQVNRHSISS
jgi:hypothetical protein